MPREAAVHPARWWVRQRCTEFITQQPTLFRCIPGRVGGDFYNDDDDDDDNDDEDDHN